MTTATVARPEVCLNRFDLLAETLPPVIDGAVLLVDGTCPGVSCDPRELLPGDFMFEQDVWLRVIEVSRVATGTAVRCGRGQGVTLTVPAGNSVPVWPLASVALHAYAGGVL